MKRLRKHSKAFTLIELIVVIAVIAILAAVLLPRFLGFSESARERGVLSDARNIATAYEAIRAEGEEPTADNDAESGLWHYLGRDYSTVDDATFALTTTGFTYSKTYGTDTVTATYDDDAGTVEVATT